MRNLRYNLVPGPTFSEVDEALYRHESPYYGYCASGFPPVENTMGDPAWRQERHRLSLLWHQLCPYRRGPEPAPTPLRQGLWRWLVRYWNGD